MFRKSFLPTVRLFLISLLLMLTLPAVAPALARPNAVQARVPTTPGDLDKVFGGFGYNGIVNPSGFAITDLVVQPDGKIVVVGDTGSNTELLVQRYLATGEYDYDFGERGEVRLPGMFKAVSVAVDSAGWIVVGGTLNNNFHLARLTATGSLDASFGTNGWVEDTDRDLETLYAILVQYDDKIVACGVGENGNDYDFMITRYNDTDGSRDVTFSGDGKAAIGFGSFDACYTAVQQGDGKLVFAGITHNGDRDFAVARLNPSGTPDTDADGNNDGNFGGDGKVVTSFGEGWQEPSAIAIQPDGKIVVLGSNHHTGESYLARYEPNGTLDQLFAPGGADGNGQLTFTYDLLKDLALLPDGRILLLGTHSTVGNADFALHRLTPDGQVDETFGFNNGVVFPDFGGIDRGPRLALLPDARILTAGTRNGDAILLRLWPNGASIDTGGWQTHAIDLQYPAGSDEYAAALAVQPDGKLLVAGEVMSPAGTRSTAIVTRFLPDGQVDAAFNALGTAFAAAGRFNSARAVALQPDGKIVIAGVTSGSGVGDDLLIARFQPSGSLDLSFGDAAGTKRIDFGSGHDQLSALALTPPDPVTGKVKIIVAGRAYNGAYDVWVVMRLDENGQPDLTFGPHGIGAAFVNFWEICGSCPVDAHAVVVRPDGRIMVGGHANFNTALAGLTADGLPDPSLGGTGIVTLDLGGNDGINALVLAPDGRLFGAGSYAPQGDNDFVITEFNANGVLVDQGSADWASGNDVAFALDWRADGQLAAGGISNSKFAWAQFSAADISAEPLQTTLDFVGTYEFGTGIRYVNDEQVVVAGWQEYQGDWNFALARFDTTPLADLEYPIFLPLLSR